MTTTRHHNKEIHMKRTLKVLLALALLLGIATPAFASSHQARTTIGGQGPITIVTPAPPIVTPAFVCQYDVYKGVLTIEVRGDQNAGRYVSVIVTNNAGDRAVALHGYLRADNGDAIWTHGVYHTYTQRNITKAWVSGHRCEGT